MKERYRNQDCAGFIEQVSVRVSDKCVDIENYFEDDYSELQDGLSTTESMPHMTTTAVFYVKLKP